MIATCVACHNTGAVGERYCSCEAAMALRARIDADPQMQELRARIERNLGAAEARTIFVRVDDRTTVIHPLGPGRN